MAVEVPCPSCGAILRAPEGSAGKKARCKKCQHGFRLPGPKASESAGEESTQLSVVEEPAFSFAAPPDPIADEPAAPREAKGSRSKYKSSIAKSSGKKSMRGEDRNEPKSRAALFLILFGIAAVIGAGGFAIYSMNQAKKPDQPTASAAPVKAEPDKPAEPAKTKDAAKKKDADKADPKAAAAPEAKGTQGKAAKPKATVSVSGGLKLPAPPAKAENLKKPAITVKVDTPFKEIRKVFITGGDSPLAVIVWKSAEGFQGAGAKDTVDRYNLSSGDRIDRTEVAVENAGWPRACDISPNGDLLLNEGPAGMLTLYDLNAKAKLGTPFKPFSGEAKAPAAALAAAYFTDNSSAIVAAKDGRLESWKAKEGEKTGSGGLGAITLSAKCFAINADRSKLIAAAGGAIHEIATKSLQETGSTPLPAGGDGVALSIDGSDRIAAIYRADQPGPHNRLAVLRLGDPKVTDIPLDESLGTPDTLDWCGADAFTFSTGNKAAALVFDTELNKPLATLWPQGGVARQMFANGKQFVLMPDSNDAKKCLLLGLDFPPDDFLPLRNEATESKAPIGFLLTPEGFGR